MKSSREKLSRMEYFGTQKSSSSRRAQRRCFVEAEIKNKIKSTKLRTGWESQEKLIHMRGKVEDGIA